MKLLELNESADELQKAQVCKMLHIAFESQGMHRPTTSIIFLHEQKVSYQTNIFLPRAQRFIDVIWSHKATERLILLELRLNSAQGSISSSLCQFFKDHSQEIHEFVYLINNLNHCDRDGYFIFKQATGEIILRYKITKFRFLSSSLSILKYLNRCIALISKIFIEEIEHIIFYYKLPGFSLVELELHLQNRNHVPLRQQAENIIFLQSYFEKQRRERKKSTKQKIQPPRQVPIAAYTALLLTDSNEVKSQQLCKLQYEQRLSSTQKMYKFEIETILHDLLFKKKGSQTILTSIKITEKVKESLIDTGGYSEIIHGIYSYVPQISIYGNIASIDTSSSNEEQALIKNSSLVKKIGIQNIEGEANISLQNQCNFLKYMRNKVCPYIAKYYCKSETEVPFSDGEIYLEYYPNNLGESRLKEERKMKIIEDVGMGLLFITDEKLIHRDLKEVNIMVDRYHRGRLIDFGSASNISGSTKFKTIDEKVRSTVGYYVTYGQALRTYPRLRQLISKDEYYSHQTFDLYGFGKILQNELYLTQFVSKNHFVRYNLHLLSLKCRELNPEDRWTIQQVVIFLRHLMIFSQLRKQFWKWGFDPRFRPHQLGKYYNGSGSNHCRKQEVVFTRQVGNQQFSNPLK